MKIAVSSKGQVVIPAEFRRLDGVEKGQTFEVERLEAGQYRLTRLEGPRNHGLVEWLKACPDKAFFVPIESESTDSL